MKGELYTIGEVRQVANYLVVMNMRPTPPKEVQHDALHRIKSEELQAMALAAQTAINMHNSIGMEGMKTFTQRLMNIMGITDEELKADLKAQDEETRNKGKEDPDDLLKDIFDRSQN